MTLHEAIEQVLMDHQSLTTARVPDGVLSERLKLSPGAG